MGSTRQHLVTRRGFCLCCTVAALGGWLSPRQAFSEARDLVSLIKDSADASPITVHRLRGNVSVLEGSGGNVAVLTGPHGKVMVDAGIGVSRPQIGLAPAGIPGEVLTGERTLALNGASIELKANGPAHTDSDISATFVEADIVHVGDTFWNGIYPFIDYSTGGSIDGMIAACDANLAATTNETIIIPGHGTPVSNRSELQDFRDMLVAIRDNVAGLKHEGRSRDETVAARPTQAFDARFGNFVIDPAYFTRLVYEGV